VSRSTSKERRSAGVGSPVLRGLVTVALHLAVFGTWGYVSWLMHVDQMSGAGRPPHGETHVASTRGLATIPGAGPPVIAHGARA
jgi:hypothetical protein